MASAAKIAKFLKSVGIPVLEHSEMDDTVDGEIKITDTIHVQVGYDYQNIVVENDDETLTIHRQWSHNQTSRLVDELRKMLK